MTPGFCKITDTTDIISYFWTKTRIRSSCIVVAVVFFSLEISLFCLTKDDSRWHSMCDNQLTTRGRSNKDKLLGAEECKSPFGVYDLRIPVDENLSCDDNKITNTNCKDLDVSIKACYSGD